MIKIEKQKKIEITENESKDEIIWQIPEYEYNQKIFLGNWLVLIVAIILFAFARLAEEFSFAVFIA